MQMKTFSRPPDLAAKVQINVAQLFGQGQLHLRRLNVSPLPSSPDRYTLGNPVLLSMTSFEPLGNLTQYSGTTRI